MKGQSCSRIQHWQETCLMVGQSSNKNDRLSGGDLVPLSLFQESGHLLSHQTSQLVGTSLG